VAAASAEAPGLRLVGPDTVEEELAAEKATEDEASAAHTPEVVGAAEAEGDESIEVLVGDAPEIEVEPPDQRSDLDTDEEFQADVPPYQPAEEEAPADVPVAAEKQAFDSAPVSSEADGDPGRSWGETVARLSGPGPEPSGTEGQPARRRLGFLRRGGRGSGS
jgi:hypothetical protein